METDTPKSLRNLVCALNYCRRERTGGEILLIHDSINCFCCQDLSNIAQCSKQKVILSLSNRKLFRMKSSNKDLFQGSELMSENMASAPPGSQGNHFALLHALFYLDSLISVRIFPSHSNLLQQNNLKLTHRIKN